MINRKKFREVFNNIHPGLGDEDSPLWEPERQAGTRPNRWFIKVRPLNIDSSREEKTKFLLWCDKFCSGQILCYYSDTDNKEEWWGFTHKDDVLPWKLKWAYDSTKVL